MKTSLNIIGESQRHRAIEMIAGLPMVPVHEVVIRERKSKRSLDQNALHWKRLDALRLHVADSTGQFYSAEDLHEFFKAKFLDVQMVEVGGDSVKVQRTTTKMNTREFSDFMESIDRYCIDRLGFYMPQPGMEDM